jgi:bifunctional non-homologous end joining protein LigD
VTSPKEIAPFQIDRIPEIVTRVKRSGNVNHVTPKDSLREYRRKRDPKGTPEPYPKADDEQSGGGDAPRFVIQEHHARALHWDVRLERDGVLVSWAVPKGLPPDPKTNHLAKHTEDHPLEYGTFEGDIPSGNYGAGHVILWDTGTYELEKWTDREVKVVLHGKRVSGRYVFFRTGEKWSDWMVHRMDPPQDPEREPLPGDLKPMLATTGALPTGEGWAYEFKWDGVRAIGTVDGGRLRLMSRNSLDVTAAYPELRDAAESLGATQVVLDGEIVALDPDTGVPDFGRLQSRMHVRNTAQARRLAKDYPVAWFVFDVLYLDGHSLIDLPYSERRERLEALELPFPVPPSFSGDGDAVLAASAEQGLEGVMAKRCDAKYRPGMRTRDWIKVKNVRRQEVVIGGWEPGEGNREGSIGALLIGVYDGDTLQYAGQVGTGFTAKTLKDLQKRLQPLERDTSPFEAVPRQYAKTAHWVDPVLVAEVDFGHWTKDGRMRHPSYKGLRDDKEAREVVREP